MTLEELTCRNYKRMSDGFILTCLTCEPRLVNFILYINPFQSGNDTSFSNASYLLISTRFRLSIYCDKSLQIC